MNTDSQPPIYPVGQTLLSSQSNLGPSADRPKVEGFRSLNMGGGNRMNGKDDGGSLKSRRGIIEVILFIVGFLSLAFLLLGIIAFSNPRYVIRQENFSYLNSGNFSYAGNAPEGVYDSPSVNTGDPIFLNLTCQIFIQFDYLLSSEQLQNIEGSYQMLATIVEPTSGWRRTIPLQTSTNFTGNTFTTVTSLNLCEISATIEKFENQSNIKPFVYLIQIAPEIQFSGYINNDPAQGSFNPSLDFQFDKTHAYLVQGDTLVSSLHPTEEGMIQIPQSMPNSISILGKQLQVSGLRTISVIGILFSIVVLSVIGIYALRIERKNQTLFYQMKYGVMMIDIQSNSVKPGTSLIDVVSMDDLARLADRSNSVIMHQQEGMSHMYYVQGNQNLYRFIPELSSDMEKR